MKKNNNKTITFIISGIIIIALLTVLIYNFTKKDYLTKLNYLQFFEKWENNESFALVISQTQCKFCAKYLPKIKNIANKYELEIFYVETDEFTADESSAFSNLLSYTGTPTTIFITNGEETSKATRINGNATEEKIINKFKVNGFIK